MVFLQSLSPNVSRAIVQTVLLLLSIWSVTIIINNIQLAPTEQPTEFKATASTAKTYHVANEIQQHHLFGESKRRLRAIPAVQSSYHAVGIFQAIPAKRSAAIIKGQNGIEKIYHEHDRLGDDLYVYKILRDRVIVSQHDMYVALCLPSALVGKRQ